MTPKYKCKSILGNNHKSSDQQHRTSFLSLGEIMMLQQVDQTDPGFLPWADKNLFFSKTLCLVWDNTGITNKC